MTRVSVVIPCFNHAGFLADALDSVRAQTWPEVETIVVDDGSTDDPASVVKRYADVRLLRQPNRGLSAARNAGWQASHGDVLIFLDADDVLHSGAAAAAVAELAAHPEAMMAFGRLELMDADGNAIPASLPIVTERFYEELLRRNYIRTPAMAALRRGVMELVGGFDPSCSPSADYDLWLRVARRYHIVAHAALVARYRQHSANMSRDPRLMLPATLRVLQRQRRFVAHQRALRAAHVFGLRRCRQFYGEQLIEKFRSALHGGLYADALASAAALVRLYPSGVRRHLVKKVRIATGHAGRATPAAETTAPRSRASAMPGNR
jgi:glycosyltransferase involved in cell wall biosynthesis